MNAPEITQIVKALEPGGPQYPANGIPAGGATGHVLKKRSPADFDVEWGAGGGGGGGAVDSVNGRTGAVVLAKDDVGLAQVDDTADADKPVSTAQQSALDLKADLVAGKVPASQLPSYVDDVLEYANTAAFPATGEAGKIYVALDTNKTYRWSGVVYIEISASLAQQNADWNATGTVAEILNKPTIPDQLSDLAEDATHRTVTDEEKAAWNAASGGGAPTVVSSFPYSLLTTDNVILADTVGDCVAQFPLVSATPYRRVTLFNTGTGNLILTCAGADTIDGGASFTLYPDESLELIGYAAEWRLL